MSNQINNVSAPQRMLWVDQMRAFAIMTVVLSHLFTFCIGGGNSSVITNYFISFYMPLFFFISGFVGYKKVYKLSFFEEVTIKAKQLLLPTIVFFCLYEWLIANEWTADLYHRSKGGYWFLLALFYITVVYSAVNRVFSKMQINSKVEDVILICIGLTFLCFPLVNRFILHNGDTDLLSLTKLSYFIYFVLGVLVRKHMDSLINILSKKWVFSSIIIVAILGYMVFEKYDLDHGFLGVFTTPILSMASVLLAMEFFRRYEATINNAMPYFQKVGTRTLDIYVIHWLILPYGLDVIGNTFATTNAHILYFATGLVIAVLVIVTCYLIGSVIRLSPMLARLILGAK